NSKDKKTEMEMNPSDETHNILGTKLNGVCDTLRNVLIEGVATWLETSVAFLENSVDWNLKNKCSLESSFSKLSNKDLANFPVRPKFGDITDELLELVQVKSDIKTEGGIYVDLATSIFATSKRVQLIKAMGQRFSSSHVLDVFRGSMCQQIKRHKHETLNLHGVGKNLSKGDASRILHRLVLEDFLTEDVMKSDVYGSVSSILKVNESKARDLFLGCQRFLV
ncbi:hypothetical protein KI387_006086, partial [Taxus chinensis]